jgi:uncharacterized protein (DUF2141 family)
MMLAAILSLALFESTRPATECDPGSSALVVRVVGLEVATGFLNVNLFDRPVGFPMEPERAWRRRRVAVRAEALVVAFECVPDGDYAVAVCHDANANEDCDKNVFGVPTESVGVSNDVSVRLRAPTFEEARFIVGADPTRITIDLDD